MTIIQACVNARLLKKAERLFTGTLNGRIIEILQNARRAGATKVEITNVPCHSGEDAPCRVMVRDNGRGIDDFAKLLDMGGSGWDEPGEDTLEAAEDPAGVGLFCLARRGPARRPGHRWRSKRWNASARCDPWNRPGVSG